MKPDPALNSLILSVVNENVVPFGGGTTRHMWTVKHLYVSNHDDDMHTPTIIHSKQVDLPNVPSMHDQHVKMLTNKFGDEMKTVYPTGEHTIQHGTLTGTSLRATHFVDTERGQHTFTHHFSKIG